MRSGRRQSVLALVVAAAALLATCVFGFLSFMPGIDPEVESLLELGFVLAGIVALGGFVAYAVTSRRAKSGEAPSRFDRLLEQRSAALAAVPAGIVAVVIGVLWYVTRALGGDAFEAVPRPQGSELLNAAGIAAFLGFGCVFIVVVTWLAIRKERAAIRAAREDLGEVGA